MSEYDGACRPILRLALDVEPGRRHHLLALGLALGLDGLRRALPEREEEQEDGEDVYEVQKLVGGVRYGIEVSTDGKVLEVEEGDDD